MTCDVVDSSEVGDVGLRGVNEGGGNRGGLASCRQCLLEALISWDTVVIVGRGMGVGERVRAAALFWAKVWFQGLKYNRCHVGYGDTN